MEAGEAEQGLGGRRYVDDRGDRTARSGLVSRRGALFVAGGNVSAAGGAPAIHPEVRWEEASTRPPDGAGSSGSDGSEAGVGAGVRGGLPSVVVRLPTEAERHAGTGSASRGRCSRGQSRPRR